MPWPRRIPPSGLSATPREESAPADVNTKNVTKENLSVIDRQIAAASTVSSKNSKKRLSEPQPERSSKRHKVDHPEPKEVVHKPKVTVTYVRVGRRAAISQSPLRGPSVSLKQEPVGRAEKVVLRTQPRSCNGRFAKKSKTISIPPMQNKNSSSPTFSRKWRNEEKEDLEESSKKKSVYGNNQDEDDFPAEKLISRRAPGFYAGRLFSNPNPQQFALKALSNMMIRDDSSASSEDDSHPVTPEDRFSSRAEFVDPVDAEMIDRFSPSRARLSCINPSPLAFAKNRWNAFGGQAITASKGKLPSRTLSLDELYVSEAEVPCPE